MANSAEGAPAPHGPALRAAKLALRRERLAARDALPEATRAAAAAAIVARLAALPSFAAARCVLLTLPYRSEWDTRALVRIAIAAGKTVAIPRVDTAARMLEARAIVDPDGDAEPGFRGIPEPRAGRPRIEPAAIDWVLVPGVAFDAAGRRLGYGGGYYDRLLPLVPPSTPRVAGAFDLQIVPRVPAAPHDLTVDAVVSESRAILIPR
jgi:5-formyltetrahydrofolate cyclo-ligase